MPVFATDGFLQVKFPMVSDGLRRGSKCTSKPSAKADETCNATAHLLLYFGYGVQIYLHPSKAFSARPAFFMRLPATFFAPLWPRMLPLDRPL